MKNIDELINDLVLSKDIETKEDRLGKIWEMAHEKGIYPASIHELYMARGRGEFSGFTVPAINLRTLTYDLARAIFRVANKKDAGAFIFEIAKSEMGYTDQRPAEYTGVCLGAAIKEGYKGPVFIQGDHFQANAKKYAQDKNKEIQGLKDLIKEAVANGFYNIDIDSSTLVDLSKPTVREQQKDNSFVCAELTEYIRGIQPKEIEVSVGGEIGEVGKENSTPEELEAYMEEYKGFLSKGLAGISKISIQTGTSHGGVVLPDGSVAEVSLDFDTLKNLSELARKKYGMSGAVQHGASTLPSEAFHKFPGVETAEVHLATEFQNMVYENEHFPADLKDKIYAYIKQNLTSEKKEGETEDQFIYKTRKKALGPFKKDIMGLSQDKRDAIGKELEAKFDFLFDQLKVGGTKKIVEKYIKPTKTSPIKSVATKEISSEGAD